MLRYYTRKYFLASENMSVGFKFQDNEFRYFRRKRRWSLTIAGQLAQEQADKPWLHTPSLVEAKYGRCLAIPYRGRLRPAAHTRTRQSILKYYHIQMHNTQPVVL